jgi:hypothetical protein
MNILFVQLPVPTLGPQRNTGNHLLASSSLYLHLRNTASCTEQIDALSQEICSRGGDQVIIDSICLHNPEIVAFTCMVWNIERTLYISRRIKSCLPQVKIWYGGPEIASDSYFLREKDPCFDLAAEGEGEEIFRLLLDGADISQLQRIHVPSGKKWTIQISVPLVKTLSTIHDPFTNGFARMEADKVIITELFRGCKYGCFFCRYHDGTNNKTTSMRPYDQVSELFTWARQHEAREVFLLDPSFEQRPDIQDFLKFLSVVNQDPVIPIFAELRAEQVDPLFAKNLFTAGIKHVETGLQTINDYALRKVGRTLDKDLFRTGIRNLQNAGIKIRTDIMLGLPGDTPDELKKTARFLSDLNIDTSAQVFKTQVLPGTMLRKAAKQYGIEFEDRPPYQVISTPQWSKSELSESLFEVESLLQINLAPDERPHIGIGLKTDDVKRMHYSDTDVCYAYYFDSTTVSGRNHIAGEKFTDTGFAVSIMIKFDNLEYTDLIRTMMITLLNSNPFSTMVIGMYIPPLFPLDIFDAIEAELLQSDFSDYLPRLFPTTYSKRPHRRMLACLDMKGPQCFTRSWLDALRNLCEIVWIADKDGCSKILTSENIAFIEPEDYIYIDCSMHQMFIDHYNLTKLDASRYSNQLIFSDIEFQWNFSEREGAK